MTYLGRISYGTYLWHWPVIVIASEIMEISSVSLFLLACLIATGIASLSYQLLETPVRNSRVLDGHRRTVIAVGLALSVIGALVLAPGILERDRDRDGGGAPVAASPAGGTPVPSSIDFDAVLKDRPGPPNCQDKEPERCIVVPGDGQRIMLMGDSHAGMLLPTMLGLAERRGDQLSVGMHNSCPWQLDITFGAPDQACLDAKVDFQDRLIPTFDPDVIVLAGRTFDDPSNTVGIRTRDGLRLRNGDPGYEELVRTVTTKTVEAFRRQGRQVVIVEPIPYPSDEDDPLRCLSAAEFVEQCRYVASPGPLPTERIFRELAAADEGVWSIDIDRLACPYLPICDPIVRGMVVKHDEGHLTATYARSLSEHLEAILVASGISI